MGRMMDIMRSADRRPIAAAAPVESDEAEDDLPPAVAEDRPITEPALEDDNNVPFIEVGGKREPTLRLVPAPEQKETGPIGLIGPVPAAPAPLTHKDEIKPPTLFTIRFQPVHAARLGGRGPVAELIAFHHPDHAVSVQYRSLAAEIARQLPGPLPRVLLFVGASGGVGTSTVLLNLAITLARQEAKVTVADAHVTRPALAQRLGLPAGPGLREVLAGQMPATWCLHETAQPSLQILPAGIAGQPRSGADVASVVELLRDRSDCVLLDAGCWGESESAAELAAASDAVYLVLGQDSAASPETTALQEKILTETGRLRGCVLTQK
jgi:Mrp family chromosome partitioning ATPase